MCEEFIKILSLVQSLSESVCKFSSNSRYVDFIKEEMNFKTSNRKRVKTTNEVLKTLSKTELLKKIHIYEALKIKTGIQIEGVFMFYKNCFLNTSLSEFKFL